MNILAVGIATRDIVNQVERYPLEDEEIRARSQRIGLGGNAANTLVVLSQLGHRVSWAGTLAGDRGGEWIRRELDRCGVDLRHARRHPSGHTPTSYVTLSHATGSRTIVHYRDLPEYGADDFSGVPVEDYDWIHFEGRNVRELERMLTQRPAGRPVCSLEVEKPRPGIEALFAYPEVLLFSRHYARAAGFGDAGSLLRSLRPRLRSGAIAVCAWGGEGAWAMDERGRLLRSPAFPPPRLVDTLGAGDVFNGAVIHQLGTGAPLEQAVIEACRLAGRKCGQVGITGLVP